MADPNHQVITCPKCHSEFTIPPNDGDDRDPSCPTCNYVIPLKKKTANGEKGSRNPGIPAARQSFNFDLPEMIISHSSWKKDARKKPLPSVGTVNSKNAQATIPTAYNKHRTKPINWETEKVTKDTPQKTPTTSPDNQPSKFKKVARKHKYPTKLWATFLAVAVLLMVGATAILKRNKQQIKDAHLINQVNAQSVTPETKEETVATTQPVENPVPIGPIQTAINEFGIRGTHERASAALKKFLEANSLEERKKFTRSLERVEPLMNQYYEKRNPGPIKHQTLTDHNNSSTLKDYYLIGVTLEDFSSNYAVMTIDEGKFLVDWEAFVGYSEMTLAQFKAKKPQSPTLFRIRVKPDDYFNFDFTPDKYRCLHLSDIEADTTIFGYVLKGTGPIASLQQGQEEFFTVRLRYPADSKSANQVFIDEVITSGWVIE